MVRSGTALITLLFLGSCAYNQRVSAPETSAAPSTPYIPPPAAGPDTTPPGNVKSILITPANNILQISFEAPADSDYKGTRIYWATSAANLNSAGTRTLLCENCVAPVTHSALSNGTTYYYLFIAYDQAGNAAAGVSANAAPSNAAITCDNTADNDCLQIASFNLEYFVSGFSGTNSGTLQASKQTGAANVILNAGFDIVALQEIKDYGVFTAWVSTYLSDDWAFTVSSSGCDAKTAFIYKRSLAAMLSVEELSTAPFNTGNWDGCLRRPLSAIFKAKHSDRQFRLINVHLKSGSDATSCSTRQPQVNDLTNYFNSTNTMPTMIMGDMNDEVKAGVGICSAIDTLNALEVNAALKILTQSPTMDTTRFTNIPYSSTIDHLIVNSSFEAWITTARLAYTADVIVHNDLNISDHQPPYLWIKLR